MIYLLFIYFTFVHVLVMCLELTFCFVELSVIAPKNTTGAVSVKAVLDSVKNNTVLISIMLANNETGILQVQYLW